MEKSHQQLASENDDLKTKLAIMESAKVERDISDDRYAPIVIKTIVFTIVGIFALAALYFIFFKVGLPQP